MRSKTWFFSVLLVCLAFSCLLPAETYWLRYRFDKDADSYLGVSSTGFDLRNSEKPEGVAMPDFNCPEPLFAKWQTPMDANGFRWVALDKTSKMRLYDVVYIDSDGDGSLADETPVKRNYFDEYSCHMGPAEVIFNTDDGPITYHLNFRYYSYDNNYKSLSFSSAGWYEGQITLADGNVLDCKLIDYQCNGTFNDSSVNFYNCDRISFGDMGREKTPFTGKYVVIAGKYYNFSAARDGAFIELSPATGIQFGTVEMQNDIEDFSAGGENGLFFPEIIDGKCELPVGHYRINLWKILRKDDQGDSWSLKGQYYYNQGGLFDVSASQTARVPVGEPLISKLEMRNRGDKQFYIQQELTDQMDGRIELLKNNNRPTAPKIVIKDKTGDYDKTFALEYG